LDKPIHAIKLDINRFKREFKRLHAMTTFQRANDKAIDIKADKWLSYKPLTRAQLFDTVDASCSVTIVSCLPGGDLSQARSTYHGATWYEQRTILKRPTEMLAVLHAQGFLILDTDFIVVRQEPNKELRYCYICGTHHEVTDFIKNKRYLNEYSYACKRSLADGKRGIWRKAA
jgi:hypothetical protein